MLIAYQDSRVTEWTDEKHSLYLKSMEASFVNQLYSSADIPAWSDVTSSRKMHCATSGQVCLNTTLV